jgi:hypothetical protein
MDVTDQVEAEADATEPDVEAPSAPPEGGAGEPRREHDVARDDRAGPTDATASPQRAGVTVIDDLQNEEGGEEARPSAPAPANRERKRRWGLFRKGERGGDR